MPDWWFKGDSLPRPFQAAGLAVASFALIATVGCSDSGGKSGADQKIASPPAVDTGKLLAQADGRACASPDVIETLKAVIKKPTGGERLMFPIGPDAIAKLTFPELTVDRVSLSAADASAKKVT